MMLGQNLSQHKFLTTTSMMLIGSLFKRTFKKLNKPHNKFSFIWYFFVLLLNTHGGEKTSEKNFLDLSFLL